MAALLLCSPLEDLSSDFLPFVEEDRDLNNKRLVVPPQGVGRAILTRYTLNKG